MWVGYVGVVAGVWLLNFLCVRVGRCSGWLMLLCGVFILLLCGVWDLVLVFLVAASQLPICFVSLAILCTIVV